MQFTIQKLIVLLAVLGLQTHYVVADCGSTCYNTAGNNSCLSFAFGESYCDSVFPNKSSCKFCVNVNCGGYGSAADIANKAICKAEGFAKEKRGAEQDLSDWTVILDDPQDQ